MCEGIKLDFKETGCYRLYRDRQTDRQTHKQPLAYAFYSFRTQGLLWNKHDDNINIRRSEYTSYLCQKISTDY